MVLYRCLRALGLLLLLLGPHNADAGWLRSIQRALWHGRRDRPAPPSPTNNSREIDEYCSLQSLVTYLSTKLDWNRFKALNGPLSCIAVLTMYGHFIYGLAEYVAAAHGAPRVTRRPMPLATLRCADPRWNRTFTGAPRRRRLPVVHFVPLGYNLRLLEALLHELYEAVDWFVLYETDATQIGVPKPLFYALGRDRWARFADKIIYFGEALDKGQRLSVLYQNCVHQDWSHERRMRTRPVELFRDILGRLALGPPEDVLVLSSDADEIATGEAVWRLSHCEARGGPLRDRVVFFGALFSKDDLRHLVPVPDGECAADYQRPAELAPMVWGSGPVGMSLARVLREGRAPRVGPDTVGCRGPGARTSPEVLHMPVGSAFHMSSVRDPVMRLFKEAGTVEGGVGGSYRGAGPLEGLGLVVLYRAYRNGSLTPALLWSLAGRHAPTVSVSSLSAEAQGVWNRSIPWLLRENPDWGCFYLPQGPQ